MSQTPTESPYRWRAADLEGIRVALSVPARLPAIRAINDDMAELEEQYPDAIPTARRELEAIAAIDTELAGLTPDQLQAPIETRLKAVAADVLPEDGTLPVKKADVIEFDTELLREETITRYGESLSIEQALRRQRVSHAQALLLMLPTRATLGSTRLQRCSQMAGPDARSSHPPTKASRKAISAATRAMIGPVMVDWWWAIPGGANFTSCCQQVQRRSAGAGPWPRRYTSTSALRTTRLSRLLLICTLPQCDWAVTRQGPRAGSADEAGGRDVDGALGAAVSCRSPRTSARRSRVE